MPKKSKSAKVAVNFNMVCPQEHENTWNVMKLNAMGPVLAIMALYHLHKSKKQFEHWVASNNFHLLGGSCPFPSWGPVNNRVCLVETVSSFTRFFACDFTSPFIPCLVPSHSKQPFRRSKETLHGTYFSARPQISSNFYGFGQHVGRTIQSQLHENLHDRAKKSDNSLANSTRKFPRLGAKSHMDGWRISAFLGSKVRHWAIFRHAMRCQNSFAASCGSALTSHGLVRAQEISTKFINH